MRFVAGLPNPVCQHRLEGFASGCLADYTNSISCGLVGCINKTSSEGNGKMAREKLMRFLLIDFIQRAVINWLADAPYSFCINHKNMLLSRLPDLFHSVSPQHGQWIDNLFSSPKIWAEQKCAIFLVSLSCNYYFNLMFLHIVTIDSD